MFIKYITSAAIRYMAPKAITIIPNTLEFTAITIPPASIKTANMMGNIRYTAIFPFILSLLFIYPP